jgi:cytochrome c oxidase assembly factor CtaG
MIAAATTPGFWDWSLDPPLALVIGLAILYWIGSRRTVAPARTHQRLRGFSFYAALAALAIALSSPIDLLSKHLFWAHMLQHVLLLVLFSTVLLAWHLPALFDATLRSEGLHALEHTLFFATAVMFWKQVIDSPPLRASLGAPQRVAYVVGAMVVSWALAVVLALAPHPVYDFYAHEASRPGGISALADQQIAAGIMWVPGSITFVIVIFVYLHRWLTPPSIRARSSRLAGEH